MFFRYVVFECLSVYDPSLTAQGWVLSYQSSFAQCDNGQFVTAASWMH